MYFPIANVLVKATGISEHSYHTSDIAYVPTAYVLVEATGSKEHMGCTGYVAHVPIANVLVERTGPIECGKHAIDIAYVPVVEMLVSFKGRSTEEHARNVSYIFQIGYIFGHYIQVATSIESVHHACPLYIAPLLYGLYLVLVPGIVKIQGREIPGNTYLIGACSCVGMGKVGITGITCDNCRCVTISPVYDKVIGIILMDGKGNGPTAIHRPGGDEGRRLTGAFEARPAGSFVSLYLAIGRHYKVYLMTV